MWWRRRRDGDFDAEIRAHIVLEADRLMADGVDPDEARAAAQRAFGNVTRTRERYRESRRWIWFDQFAQDLRYGWRSMWRSRTFVATTALTLAVGLGLITAVFTVFNAYVLRPFAVRDPQGLYELGWSAQEAGGRRFRWRDYEGVRSRQDLFENAIAHASKFVDSEGSSLHAGFVSGDYFDALGVRMQFGRGIAEYDARVVGDAPVVVLTDQIWARRYDRDPDVLGRQIELNGERLQIVGVARPEFAGLDDTPLDLWLPITMSGPVAKHDVFGPGEPRDLSIVVRLRPEVTPAQAAGALALEPFATRVSGRLDAVRAVFQPQGTPVRLTLELLAILTPLVAAFALVLVAACANASNVMLARANARHREIGVRLSLGASRSRVVRQLLTEGLLIALLAGLVGIALAGLLLRAGVWLFFAVLPAIASARARIVPLDFDHRVFLFSLAVASIATLMFALLPALQATRLTLTDALRGQATSALRGSTLRNFLVGSQVAVSLVLLILAATLVRNGLSVGRADLGFEPHGILSVNQRDDDRERLARAYRVLADDPRLELVSVTSRNPLFGNFFKTPVRQGSRIVPVSCMFISPDYLSLLRIPILRGRAFGRGEGNEQSGVAIVSAAGAQALWPGEDPIGKVLRLTLDLPGNRVAETIRMLRRMPEEDEPGMTVVTVIGVAKDVVSGFIYEGKDAAHVYLPTSETGSRAGALLVRPRPGANVRVDTMTTLLQSVDADPQVFEVLPLASMVTVQLFPLRIASWIGSFLGAVALALSVSGIYGVLMYAIGQRRREIGIRMALGATAPAIVGLVMRQSARLAVVGAAVGLLLSVSALTLLSAFVRLENVSIVDAGAFAGALVLVALAVAVASYGPAWRAARIDPSDMLRSEG